MLSEADHQKIAAAVGAAEARTTGEIVCILTREVSNYREVPLAWAIAVALIAPPLALLAGLPAEALTPWARDWSAGAAPAVTLTRALEAYGLLQVVLFALVAGVASIPQVRRALTPAPLKRHRVHRAALQQFLATGLHLSTGRTGVVIFASQHDRRVELLADDAIPRGRGRDHLERRHRRGAGRHEARPAGGGLYPRCGALRRGACHALPESGTAREHHQRPPAGDLSPSFLPSEGRGKGRFSSAS